MVKVKLEGLKIAHARGKYYVYVRETGEALLRGFDGDGTALRQRLAMPDMIGAYNARRRFKGPISYPDKTLGWLVAWFSDPEQCQDFKELAESTQHDYKDRLPISSRSITRRSRRSHSPRCTQCATVASKTSGQPLPTR